MERFGQRVILTVYDEQRKQILNTGGLRVDFDVRVIGGFNRAKFTIYNLTAESAKQVTNGIRYVKIKVGLHDYPMQELRYDFYVNNAITIKQVPNSITELYCVDSLKKDLTLQQAQDHVRNYTLRKHLTRMRTKDGRLIAWDFKSMPSTIMDYSPPKDKSNFDGSIEGILKKLQHQYGFNYTINGEDSIKLYMLENDKDQFNSKENEEDVIKLQTVNMRSNPRVSAADIQFESNLNFNIAAGDMVDSSDLLTATPETPLEVLVVANKFLNASVSGSSRFRVLEVKHVGSNYTKQWSTFARAVKGYKGLKMSTYNWF